MFAHGFVKSNQGDVIRAGGAASSNADSVSQTGRESKQEVFSVIRQRLAAQPYQY